MDRYDQEVERLTKNPRLIADAWSYFENLGPHSPLFDRCGQERGEHGCCGCLTQIAICGASYAETPALTGAIKSDTRIPKSAALIEVADLPVFAEWQRRIDKELGRTPPPLLTEVVQ